MRERRDRDLQDVLVFDGYGSGDDMLILHLSGREWGVMILWWFGVNSVVGAVDLPF